jgi:hypothetical protein
MDLVVMSKEELQRLEVMKQLQEKRISQRTAAEELGVCVRHLSGIIHCFCRSADIGGRNANLVLQLISRRNRYVTRHFYQLFLDR